MTTSYLRSLCGALALTIGCSATVEPARPTGVTFLGDSITLQLGALSDWFGPKAATWVNAGVGGNSTTQLLERLPAVVDPTSTGTCVIMGGLNDLFNGDGTAVAIANLQRIAEQLETMRVRPVFVTLLPVTDAYPDAVALNGGIRTVNTWLRAYATAHQVTLIDAYPVFLAPSGSADASLYQEGLHPNELGQAKLTALERSELQRLGVLP